MRRALQFAVVALILFYTGTLSAGATAISYAFQEEPDSELAYVFIVDTSSEMQSYLDSLQANADALVTAIDTPRANYFALMSYLGDNSNEENGNDETDDNLFEEDMQTFKDAVLGLSTGQASGTLNLLLQRAFASDVSSRPNLHMCFVLITNQTLENVNLNMSGSEESDSSLSIRFALVAGAVDAPQEFQQVKRFDVSQLSGSPIELFGEVASFCEGTVAQPEQETGQAPAMNEDEAGTDQPASPKPETPAEPEVPAEAPNDIEAILQRHTADIALLKQNVSALSALLSNVPVLEALQARIDEQQVFIESNSTTIADLQARLGVVEAYSTRLDQIENALDRVNVLEQTLNDLSTSVAGLEARLTVNKDALAALPISQYGDRLDALEQSTSAISTLRIDVDLLTSSLEQVNTEITNINAEIAAIRDEISALPIEVLSQRIDALQSQLNAEIAELGDRFVVLEDAADGFRMRFDRAESRLADIEAAISNLPITEIEENITMLGSEIRALNDVDRAHNMELQRIGNELDRLDELSGRIDANRAQIEILNRLSTRVDALENAQRELSRELINNGDAIAHVEALSLDLSDATRALRSDLDALAQRVRAQSERTDVLDTRMMADRVAILGRLDVLESEFSRIQGDISRVLQNAVTRTEFAQRNERVNAEQRDQNRIAEELMAEVEQLKSELSAIKMIFSDLNEETRQSLLNNFGRDFRQMERDLQELRSLVVVLGVGVILSVLGILYLAL